MRPVAMLAFLLAVLTSATATAQLTVYRIDSAGYYAVQDGRLVCVTIVTPDNPVPPPDDDTLTARAAAIKAAAEAVTSDPQRTKTAQQLAELYRQIGAKVTAGQVKGQATIAFAVKYATDTLLNGKGRQAAEAWQPVRDVFSQQWAAVLNAGGSDADYAKLLGECATGLNASAPGEPQIDIAMIIKIIEMVLEILKLLPFNAG
jgi:hypothetical protein